MFPRGYSLLDRACMGEGGGGGKDKQQVIYIPHNLAYEDHPSLMEEHGRDRGHVEHDVNYEQKRFL